jgi:putative peptide zinc metalloprotease protein
LKSCAIHSPIRFYTIAGSLETTENNLFTIVSWSAGILPTRGQNARAPFFYCRILVAIDSISDYDAHRLFPAEARVEKAHSKLRSDLEIHPEANSSVVVKDPIANRFYRFTPVQASVLELLNGQLSFDYIAGNVSQKHQTEVLETQVKEFTEKLQSLFLLDNPYCWAKLADSAARKRGFLHNLLSIKIHVFNPDALLTRLEKKLRFFFRAQFSVLTAIIVFVAFAISINNWESIFLSFGELFSIYSMPMIVIVVFAMTTIHEFAHGMTLKHFGGRTTEMGFLILYFIPAFYCNVSDAWMLKKRERVLVTAAGNYIQVFLWACATIAWRLLAPETVASQVCLIAIAFSGIVFFLNLNPLIRLDGYYLMSDLAEISNLRPKSFAYLKNKLESWVTGMPSPKAKILSRREKRIFLWYGLSSSIFTAILLFLVILRLGGWMIRQYQGFGLLLSSLLIVIAIAPVAARENKAFAATLLKSAIKRIKKSPGISLIIGLIIVAGFIPWELKVSGDFSVLAAKKIAVTPQVSGNLKTIYVEQGNRVHSGDVLAEIENLELANSVQEAAGELASQRAALDLLKAGSRPEEIERARRLIETRKTELQSAARIEKSRTLLLETIAKKTAELENARLNYERTQSLLANGLVARNEADRDQTAFQVQQRELLEAKGQLGVLEEQTDRDQDIKRKELAQAESELGILLAGPRKESIRVLESQIKKLEEELKILEQQLGLLKIRAPIDGIVASPYLPNRIGDYLDKGDVFCQIVSEGNVIIEMPVPEKEIDVVRLGLPITMKVRSYPKRYYVARISNIAPVAEASGLERTVMVWGYLENSDGSLKAGMTGVGKILCGKKRIAEIATRRAIRWLRTEFWEYLP